MKRFLPILLFVFTFFGLKQSQAGSTCNWGARTPYFLTWDSCGSKLSKNKGMLNGYIAFNYSKSSCFKYQWTVNGNNVTTNRAMTFMPSANGKYSVCVKVTDTCNGCDTTFCSSMGITCIGTTTTSKCNWKSRNPYFLTWDSCGSKLAKNKGMLNGYIAFNYAKSSCFKYQWTVNGNNVTTNRVMTFMPSSNGKYSVCVKVTDTCNGCDTTFCSSTGITCLGSTSTSKCDWQSRNVYFLHWDSCGTKGANNGKIYGYIYFNYSKMSCFKYQWTVDGKNVTTSRSMTYLPTANGKYNVCVKVTDTCSGCDTTFCSSIGITCLGSTSLKCDWQSRKPYFIIRDSCSATSANKGKIYGYIYFGYTKSGCFKYQWTVNTVNISTARPMDFTPKSNGTYDVCVKVTDTCSGCDTTFCTAVVINCLSSSTSKCNWQSRNPYFMTWDSCKSALKYDKIYGYVGFNYAKSSCFKYQWSVNDTIVSTARYFNYQVYANGNYKMCVKIVDTCNNCDTIFCNTLAVKCFGTTGLNYIETNKLSVYPNPTNGLLIISGVNSSTNYILRDLNGRILRNSILTENKIEISEFQQGIYFLAIKKDGNWINTKIMRN
jgi:hypothetical protein